MDRHDLEYHVANTTVAVTPAHSGPDSPIVVENTSTLSSTSSPSTVDKPSFSQSPLGHTSSTSLSVLPHPSSPALSASRITINNNNLQVPSSQQDNVSLHGGTRTSSLRSRQSSRPGSIQHIATAASAFVNNTAARRIRLNMYRELVNGWYHLSTSSKILIVYYLSATIVEIITTVTVMVIERENIHKCYYLVIFLALYLIRALVICWSLLRRFLYEQPDDLPTTLGGACGAHYKTLINWGSLVLVLFSIAILTTQSQCAKEAPALFYLTLAFSLVGYLTIAMLLTLWLVVLFCLNGLVFVLELFGVGPTVMRWQGATQEMIDDIPIIKYSKPSFPTTAVQQQKDSTEKGMSSNTTSDLRSTALAPTIVVSDDQQHGHGQSSRLHQQQDEIISIPELSAIPNSVALEIEPVEEREKAVMVEDDEVQDNVPPLSLITSFAEGENKRSRDATAVELEQLSPHDTESLPHAQSVYAIMRI
ncbi:hypothetical protein FBU30_004569 [Linnemannia zychae]|nr:hypothetical protein FBU30_004569 [Linnemannia zychae]